MDATDDDALTWEGDDDLAERRRARRGVVADHLDEPGGAGGRDDPDEPPGGRLGSVLVMLAVAMAVESALWVQSVFTGPLASTLGTPSGTLVERISWAVILVVRIAGVLAPLVWFGVAAALIPDHRRRAAVALVGVVLLLPWPALVRL